MGAEDNVFDAAIIGGGPAGVSCAIWLARLGFAPILLEAENQIGGLCRLNPFDDEWNASLPGVTGQRVADNLASSLDQAKVPVRLSYAVAQVEPGAHGFTVTSKEGVGAALHARHIVLATGVTARSLPGADNDSSKSDGSSCSATAPRSAFYPRLLIGPGEHVVAQDFWQKRVAVLGGGDNAFENALYAIERGASCVHIYARTVRAQQQFVRQIAPADIILGNYEVDATAFAVNGQPYDVIMVFYGWEPCVEFANALGLLRTKQGFIATDVGTAETSYANVYAIGEVAQRQHPCVVTALADGVAAAKAIQARIERRSKPDSSK